MNIIETVGAWGVKTTDFGYARATTPHPGDLVLFPSTKPDAGIHEWTPGSYGRIELVGTGHCDEDEVHVCCNMGSAFLDESGGVSISGGPFMTIKRLCLESTFTMTTASFWNWGDNSPGKGQAVDYFLVRPVFLYTPEEANG